MSKGNGVSSYTHTQQQLDDYANQHNPNNHGWQDNWDNHANQLNPNNEEYKGNQEKDNKNQNKKIVYVSINFQHLNC